MFADTENRTPVSDLQDQCTKPLYYIGYNKVLFIFKLIFLCIP